MEIAGRLPMTNITLSQKSISLDGRKFLLSNPTIRKMIANFSFHIFFYYHNAQCFLSYSGSTQTHFILKSILTKCSGV